MIALALGVALAGGLHAGVDPARVPGLGQVLYMSPAGWSAPLADGSGSVRVFVGTGEQDAVAFYADGIRKRRGQSVAVGDIAIQDGTEVYARDGNLVVYVRSDQPVELARRVLGRAADYEEWPVSPEITVSGQSVRVAGAWSQVLFVGAETVTGAGSTERTVIVPTGRQTGRLESGAAQAISVTAWDRYGRVAKGWWVNAEPAVELAPLVIPLGPATPATPATPLAVPID